ncbi:MAG TPA: DMT family transporter [Leeuwenhoekiella sp.]|nr:DMT family transporter [Leeuwenhoekiella sp.]
MYLLYSILSSTVIFIVFKLFSRFGINRLQAIVMNYVVACAAGLVLYERPIAFAEIPDKAWFFGALLLGVLFILIFNLMALTTQRSGIAVVSVATKMSVVIPILFGVFYYKDQLGILKLTGIILALVAVYLASIKQKDGLQVKKENLIFPVLVFLGSGIIDASIKFLEASAIAKSEVPLFSALIFAAAFAIGLIFVIIQVIKGKLRLQFKNVLAGIALGVPNYFSIYFLVQALRNDWESSTVFLINNVGIVVVSTLAGILLFQEKLLLKNWIGLILAVIGIVLVSISR